MTLAQKLKHSSNSEVDAAVTDKRSAGQKVFDILLLAETILSNLDMSILVTAYGTIHKIATVIDNTTRLQKRMFLLPATSFTEAEIA